MAGTLTACSSAPRDPVAVPEADITLAEVPGFSDIRFFLDEPTTIDRPTVEEFARQRLEARMPTDQFSILALSGGGSDGAFGAGFLSGWTERGDRPEFDVVTGISTGALIAPFAFLGSAYDRPLEQFYTETETSDIVELAILGVLAGGASVGDTAPLRRMMVQILNADFVAELAREHERGRRLYVGTTHLDAERPVMWDIGAIAASDNPRAPDLIRDVLLASASIPGAFPPVLFDVIANGRTFQEMHVDGGVTRAIFVYPPNIDIAALLSGLRLGRSKKSMFLIRNGKITPDYSALELQLLPIAARSISTLIKSQNLADLAVIEGLAKRDGFDFHLAHIDATFNVTSNDLFDRDYMKALFKLGYEQATSDMPWTRSLIP